MSHPEAMNAPWTKHGNWALIMVPHRGGAVIIASSSDVTCDCQEISNYADDIGIRVGSNEPGMYLWQGQTHYDGLDGIDYIGKLSPISWEFAHEWFTQHEPFEPSTEESFDPLMTLFGGRKLD